MSTHPFLIAGGGIGGLTAALALHRAGFEVQVYERAEALQEVGAGLSLWPNATRVLARLGVLEPLIAQSARLTRVQILDAQARRLAETTAPGGFEVPSLCVHRATLQTTLAAALPAECLHLGTALQGFTQQADQVVLLLGSGEAVRGQALVGADGLRSTVRQQLLGDGPPTYRGYAVWRGLAAYALPETNAGREYWGAGRRFGLFPLGDARTYWYATANEPADQADPTGMKARMLQLFARWAAPIPDVLAATEAADIAKHATYDRLPVRRWTEGRVTLLGDAAHPTTPNLGQGACMAIEDAAVLTACLLQETEVPAALRQYSEQRQKRTARIVRQSLQVGKMGQWQHPFAVLLRNAVTRAFPDRVGDATQRALFAFDAWQG